MMIVLATHMKKLKKQITQDLINKVCPFIEDQKSEETESKIREIVANELGKVRNRIGEYKPPNFLIESPIIATFNTSNY